eukprot:jgi/Botrbrau1/3911/Bobra.0183s0132.1
MYGRLGDSHWILRKIPHVQHCNCVNRTVKYTVAMLAARFKLLAQVMARHALSLWASRSLVPELGTSTLLLLGMGSPPLPRMRRHQCNATSAEARKHQCNDQGRDLPHA